MPAKKKTKTESASARPPKEAIARSSGETGAPAAGANAPEFSLTADDTKTVSLADLRGKKVLLYFYPKDDTPGCTLEACGLRDSVAKFKKRNVVILGVSRDSVLSHQRFKAKYALPFALLSDPDAEVIRAYGSWGKKSFMGITREGILRTSVLIDEDGKILRIWPKVATKTHAADVLAALDEQEKSS